MANSGHFFNLKIKKLIQPLLLFIETLACCTTSDVLPNSNHLTAKNYIFS